MKTYKGKIEIDCVKGKKPCPKKVAGDDVRADCPDCSFASIRIVDLEGKVLFELPPIPEADKKKKPKKTTK